MTKGRTIPLGNGQAVFMRPADDQECAVHDWPLEGFVRRLVQAMKDTHPTGINACRECLKRAKASLPSRNNATDPG